MKPKFDTLTFKTEKSLKEWLKKTSKYIIELDPISGDMQMMWVHKSGEILHTNFHSKIYTGKFIYLKSIEVGKCLEIYDGERMPTRYNRLIIDKLITEIGR